MVSGLHVGEIYMDQGSKGKVLLVEDDEQVGGLSGCCLPQRL